MRRTAVDYRKPDSFGPYRTPYLIGILYFREGRTFYATSTKRNRAFDGKIERCTRHSFCYSVKKYITLLHSQCIRLHTGADPGGSKEVIAPPTTKIKCFFDDVKLFD